MICYIYVKLKRISVKSFKARFGHNLRATKQNTQRQWKNMATFRVLKIQNGSASFRHTCIRDGSRSTTLDKGQIFGSGLQLCASGAPAEPESTISYRDQRHPHTVKCQAQRRARAEVKKWGGEDKARFTMVNFGVAHWKGQCLTLTLRTTTHIPPRSSEGRKKKGPVCSPLNHVSM